MNVENILAVADAIEKHSIPDLGFNMGDFFSDYYADRSGHNCGTSACIAGWACVLQGMPRNHSNHADAQDWMGLTEAASNTLFYGEGAGDFLSEIEPAQAVATLRHLAESGVVDWKRAVSPVEAA